MAYLCLGSTLACGGRSVPGDGETGSGSGTSSSSDSATETVSATASSETGPAETTDNTETQDTQDTQDTQGTKDTTDTDDTTDTTDTSDTAGAGECVIAIALDTCCTQAFTTRIEVVESETCWVSWPVDWANLPEDLVAECVAAQPKWCAEVDCDYSEPPSEVIEETDDLGCAWVCPEEQFIMYTSPGCALPETTAQCVSGQDPCFEEYCSCEGETVSGCGGTGVPYAHIGACE